MTAFDDGDGTRLVFHETGHGPRLVCAPGGPMQASDCLGDLGGLGAHRTVVRLDLRGTGASAVPRDRTTYRCDRPVDDLEALRLRLGEARLDLLAHSAGAALAVLYTVRHPYRVRTLTLITPSPRVVGLEVSDDARRGWRSSVATSPGFPPAYAAIERIWAGAPTDADWDAIAPFTHGRWDAPERATAAADDARTNTDAAAAYYGDGAFDTGSVRAGLAVFPRRCWSSRAASTSPCPRTSRARARGCSPTPNSPCSPAPATSRGATIPRGAPTPWPGSSPARREGDDRGDHRQRE